MADQRLHDGVSKRAPRHARCSRVAEVRILPHGGLRTFHQSQEQGLLANQAPFTEENRGCTCCKLITPYSGRDLCSKVTPVILHGVVSPDLGVVGPEGGASP